MNNIRAFCRKTILVALSQISAQTTPEHFLIIDQHNMNAVACRLKGQSANDVTYGQLKVVQLCDGVDDCLGGADEQPRACNFKERATMMKKVHDEMESVARENHL
ncbi:PREDICTED: uncharacterized protein LOC106811364 [Priapulus caudatus]|uniref:Uncharacterized protein LOC106811364 n=1 Tax=Priapulus caudatus TaxID=37621 RepID=A0ABM1EE14_PRICU|nr:PREDICTED: uncharacterized protein LOC106811364 [Priapulus caudatus]